LAERHSDGIHRRENSTEGNNFMIPENTDTPQKADCPSAACSPSDYDAGLMNDFGGGDVGWWQDYLRAEIGRANDYWREIHDQQNALMVRLYNQGYHAGHEDTVEACFVPIHHTDMDTYHADAVEEILQENDQAHRSAPGGEVERNQEKQNE
jgi:hypothetical protein